MIEGGSLELRRVLDPGELAPALASILDLADFREGARSGRLLSRESSVLRARLDHAAAAGSLHVAIVERDGRLVAGHAGEWSDRGLELLVAGRSPLRGEAIDPEAYLAGLRALARTEGIRHIEIRDTAAAFFDSTSPVPLAEPVPWRQRAARARWNLRQRLWSSEEFRCYRLRLADYVPPLGNVPLNRNSLADLMDYAPGSRDGLSRQAFLAIALARLGDGRLVYTVAEGGRLLHSCWLIPKPGELPVDPDHAALQPSGAALLSDSFTDPSARGRGLQIRGILWRIHEARALDGVDAIMGYVIGTNRASRRNLEKTGFEHAGSLITICRLGLVWHRQSAADPHVLP
jgi:hypothetical protein